MTTQLRIAIGQCSDKGVKPLNQDFHGALIPAGPLLDSKGIALAIADGIGSSQVSQEASQTAVKGFLEDYYATPEAWSVKTSVQRVMQACNSWLYAQTRNGPHRYNMDRGYVCTFSAMVLKGTVAHIFHVGDARVYRVVGDRLEQLTQDHRLWVSRDSSYLSRALGMRDRIEIDYLSLELEVGDTFVLATDGIHEFVDDTQIVALLREHAGDAQGAAEHILASAQAAGSDDNLTVQLLRIEALPQQDIGELHRRANLLPFPPALQPRMEFDGYRILRELHNSNRSHVYLALEIETGRQVALKTPSVDLRDDRDYLERFLMEEWAAQRVDSVHLVRACPPARGRSHLYTVAEYIEGQTLAQWMADNPRPPLETVRGMVEQIARGLRALHRQEMLHQDLRPGNVMIDANGTLKLIDLGSVRVAGVADSVAPGTQAVPLGTAQYMAPEYFLGHEGTPSSDLYSLAAIAYQMLSGRLPYGPSVARATSRAAQRRLAYATLCDTRIDVPSWVDDAMRKALHPEPHKRYQALSEFAHDLRRPNSVFLHRPRPSLMERNPLKFWQGLSALLLLTLLLVLAAGTRPSLLRPADECAGQSPGQALSVLSIEELR